MAQLTLVIGNKNYSSWSLRPWLLLKHLGLPEPAAEYAATVLADPAVRDWVAAGRAEPGRAAWLERGGGRG